MADGAALFSVRAETPGDGTVQPFAEVGLHFDRRTRGAILAHRHGDVQAHAVFVASVFVWRISPDTHLAFRRDVRLPGVYSRTSDHGRTARVGEFLLHVFGVEARAGISGIIGDCIE